MVRDAGVSSEAGGVSQEAGRCVCGSRGMRWWLGLLLGGLFPVQVLVRRLYCAGGVYVCVFSKAWGKCWKVVQLRSKLELRVRLGFGVETLCERRATAPLLVLNSDHGFALRSCVALASLSPPLYLSFLVRKMVCRSHCPHPTVHGF